MTPNNINSFEHNSRCESTDKVIAYLDMILERNQHINLTAIKDRDEAYIKHVVDSLSVCDLPEYKSAKTVIDVGTGAGFPGALLAIASPDKEFVLLDSTLKRLRVIDEFAEKLEINNLRTVHARAEEIQRKPEFSGQFNLCVSRAVASMDKLCGWCLPFVKKGGYFIAYKGENYAAEVDAAAKALSKNHGKIVRIVPYPEDAPAELSGHVLIVIKRT